MNVLSIVAGVVAGLFLLLGILPFFGWLNWILTVPTALLGLVLGLIGRGRAGTVLNVVVLLLAGLRLMLGGGIF
nr:hypothetical protein [Deinococcus peraridilitoris]